MGLKFHYTIINSNSWKSETLEHVVGAIDIYYI